MVVIFVLIGYINVGLDNLPSEVQFLLKEIKFKDSQSQGQQ